MSTRIYALQSFTATDGTVVTANNPYTLTDTAANIAFQRGQAQPLDGQGNHYPFSDGYGHDVVLYSYDSTTGLPNGTIDPSSGLPIYNRYLGIVGTRGCVPSASAGSNKQAMSRTKHVAMDNINALQLVYANFYCPNNGTETNAGGIGQYTASIEYPVGTITRATFSGSFTGSIADGGLLVSDPLAVVIPKGASFYVRSWQNNAGGAVYSQNYGLNTTAAANAGEWWTFGVTTNDLTNSTTNAANQSSTNLFKPTAIIGMTTRPSFYIAGDSRISNGVQYDTVANAYGGLGEVERSLVKTFATFNAGMGGETMASAAGTGATKRLQLAQYCSHVICEYGINDCIAATAAATTLANMLTFAAKFGGKPFYQTTLSPKSASTDLWATTVNQTTDATANPIRLTLNAAIRSGLRVPVSGYIEIADQVESARDSGLWKVTGSANGYTADGLHGNSAGNYLIESSTAFQNIAP